MLVYLCPICCANLEQARNPMKGFCPDCHVVYSLDRCITMERIVPSDERARCLEAGQ
ncbi:hypothetical protein [Candidatus Methanoprimaticola sp. MG2]|uniref:hypothetical protein n=1 Tax=Candidatus Methanoprimaticola sp. MG2 TaxID=3228838 RepID=UPI0039C61719